MKISLLSEYFYLQEIIMIIIIIIIIIGEMRLSASSSALTYSIFVLQTCCFINFYPKEETKIKCS